MGLSWQDSVTVVVRLSQAVVEGKVSGKRKPGTLEPLEGCCRLGAQRRPNLVLPQHVLREGMWSDGEGPSLLVGILWFPFWHLFLSVLRALLTLPALVSFPVKEEEG